MSPSETTIQTILAQFGLGEGMTHSIAPLGKGLINNTWKITLGNPSEDSAISSSYVIQKINQDVFKNPRTIDANLSLVGAHLKKKHPDYYLPLPLPATNGESLLAIPGDDPSDSAIGYYRLMPFVSGAVTIEVVATPGQAYEAALQFGRFTRRLHTLDIRNLHPTIPLFHDLGLRYRQFNDAMESGNQVRVHECAELIAKLIDLSQIVEEYEKLQQDPGAVLRATHHGTKISNVLFDGAGKGLCVIDLDTVMPGYFISDLGDMIRTYICPVSEEEADTTKIGIRPDFYQALIQGYSDEMGDELTDMEKEHFKFAGLFMTYMQALRFLTDYLLNDIYYGAKYPRHNLVRATNQCTLLERLSEL
jgi:Ser/Thr protein kinase RdoA (MazF antagonist)